MVLTFNDEWLLIGESGWFEILKENGWAGITVTYCRDYQDNWQLQQELREVK